MTWEGLWWLFGSFLAGPEVESGLFAFSPRGGSGSGSDRDMSQVLSYFLGQGILVPPVSDRRVASISNIVYINYIIIRSCAYM